MRAHLHHLTRCVLMLFHKYAKRSDVRLEFLVLRDDGFDFREIVRIVPSVLSVVECIVREPVDIGQFCGTNE